MLKTKEEREGLMALRLTVNNHPGVMSHVCGLFARRAFNLEGILVTPVNGGDICTMWLIVQNDSRVEQMVKQVQKLYDVREIRMSSIENLAFDRLDGCMRALESAAI